MDFYILAIRKIYSRLKYIFLRHVLCKLLTVNKTSLICVVNRVAEIQRFMAVVELADTVKMVDELDQTAGAMKNSMKQPTKERQSSKTLVDNSKEALNVVSERLVRRYSK